MAVTQLYTAVPNDVITAARWNNEFGNIYNNGTAIAFPLTAAVSLAGYTVYLDQAQTTSWSYSAAKALIFTPGAKTGTPGTGAAEGNALDIASFTFTDSATAGSGTAAEFSAVSIGTPTLAATNASVTTTDAATLYIQGAPIAGTNETITNPWAIWVDGGAVRFDGVVHFNGGVFGNSVLNIGTVVPQKHIAGLAYARDTDTANDILLATGEACSDDATPTSRRLMVLSSAISGQVDTGTWVVGTGQPKLDTGTVADVPYYIWLIQRADTGVVDFLMSASGTAPTMPTNYSFKRLIGYFSRVGGVNLSFSTKETFGGALQFIWSNISLDVDLAATLTTSRRTDALRVPLAFSVLAHVRISVNDAAATSVWMTGNPDETDAAPSITVAPLATGRVDVAGAAVQMEAHIQTSSAGLVASRANVATVDTYRIATLGFMWSRR